MRKFAIVDVKELEEEGVTCSWYDNELTEEEITFIKTCLHGQGTFGRAIQEKLKKVIE